MGFFSSVEKHLDNINLNMVITKGENGLIVSVLPVLNCKDDTKKNITPILLKGTADELDEQFAGIIQQPLELVSGVATNIIEFEQSVTKAKEKSAVSKDAEKKEAKAKTKAEKDAEKAKLKADKDLEKINLKADKELVKAETYIEKKEYGKAIFMIKAALKISPEYHKALKMLKETEALDEPDMFSAEEKLTDLSNVPNTLSNKEPIILGAESKEEVANVKSQLEKSGLAKPTSIKEVDMESQQEAEKPKDLKGTKRPKRIDMESMADYEERTKDWVEANEAVVNKTPLKGEDDQLSKAMHEEEIKNPFKEKVEHPGMKPNPEFDTENEEDFDEFDDLDF